MRAVAIGLLLTCVVVAPAAAEEGRTVIGVGPEVFFDDGAIEGEERRSAQLTDEGLAFANDQYFAVALWATTEVLDRLRLGGKLRYLGSYELTDDADEDDPPDVTRLGQLLEMTAQLEVLLEMSAAFDLILGLEAGLSLLFPDGELEAEIDGLIDQGVDAWSAPRLGYVVGPHVGLNYRHSDKVGFRLDFGFKWEQLFLFAISDEVSGVTIEKTRRADIIRFQVALAVEVAL